MSKARSYIGRDDDTRHAVALALDGKTQREIADELGISQTTVSFDLKRARQRWAETIVGDLNAAKADELVRIEHIQVEALAGWEQTKRAGEPNAKLLDIALKASLR